MYRKCRICQYPMDPGEGKNGICEDCLEKRQKLRSREEQLMQIVLATDYKQMEMEDFLYGR